MVSMWTNEEIEKILIQLDAMELPFKKYCFMLWGKRLKLLGAGSFANVYEAKGREEDKKDYAIKVIGFSQKKVETDDFVRVVKKQRFLGKYQENLVRIYDFAKLRVWFDENNNVMKAGDKAELDGEQGNYLDLQFIVMEKVSPVLWVNHVGKQKLFSGKLAEGNEQEILKLAYEIGNALDRAHKEKLIHRDIKLENIFYSQKEKCYKLGDFGIAKLTTDGAASTIAFTKGYGAPEVVGALEERYDYTADIYSFGMLLFILLNRMKFPGSHNYNVNQQEQYSTGYELPHPECGSNDLYRIVKKMCSFNPDDRYQSMEEVLNELEGVMLSKKVTYKKAHLENSIVIGTILLFAGAILWKMTFAPSLKMDLSFWTYVFLGLVGTRCFVKNEKVKPFTWTGSTILGIVLLFANGFTWWKSLLLIMIIFSEGVFSGMVAGGIFLMNITYLLMHYMTDHSIWNQLTEYKWMAVTLLSLAMVLVMQYYLLNIRIKAVTSMVFKYNIYWIFTGVVYGLMILYGWLVHSKSAVFLAVLLGERIVQFLRSFDLIKTGIVGLIFCLFWVVREHILHNIEKKNSL